MQSLLVCALGGTQTAAPAPKRRALALAASTVSPWRASRSLRAMTQCFRCAACSSPSGIMHPRSIGIGIGIAHHAVVARCLSTAQRSKISNFHKENAGTIPGKRMAASAAVPWDAIAFAFLAASGRARETCGAARGCWRGPPPCTLSVCRPALARHRDAAPRALQSAHHGTAVPCQSTSRARVQSLRSLACRKTRNGISYSRVVAAARQINARVEKYIQKENWIIPSIFFVN